MAEQAPATFTSQQVNDLNNFAERNRRADEHAELIPGMPGSLERSVIYIVGAALVITIALLYFGKIDVVVEAKGKILPEGDVLQLQAVQGGVVRNLYAHAGDHLAKGSPIMVIDASEAGLNLDQVRRKREQDQSQLELQKSTLQRLDRVLADPKSLLKERQPGGPIAANAFQLLNALENAELKLDTATNEERLVPERKQQQQQEYDVTKQRVALLRRNREDNQREVLAEQQALARKKEQLLAVRKLAENKLLSVVELNTEEERYRSAEAAMLADQQRLDQMAIDISTTELHLSELQTKLQTIENESHSNTRAAQAQYDQALANLGQERENLQILARGLESDVAHAEQQVNVGQNRLDLATVRMPVDGTIADFKVRNAGEIVAAGASLGTVVPQGVPLMVEAELPDKDVGFVHPGVAARIKVDAFPFQQFGTARAEVEKVLPAVGANAKFVVQLRILDSKLSGSGDNFYLFPGLTVQADVITQRQRLLELLFQNQQEGGKAGGQ